MCADGSVTPIALQQTFAASSTSAGVASTAKVVTGASNTETSVTVTPTGTFNSALCRARTVHSDGVTGWSYFSNSGNAFNFVGRTSDGTCTVRTRMFAQ